MRISIISNATGHSQKKKRELEDLIRKKGLILSEKNPEIVISIGGDGTLLAAFHRYVHQLNSIRFIGIHTGHLGFYTDWRDYELEELVDSLAADVDNSSVSYPLLDVQVNYSDQRESKHFLALNECTVRRVTGTMVGNVFIKGELFEIFRGDGLSVSTPTGSTAYNKSIGGAVIHPQINALQLAEIASINNRVYRTLGSPLIIASNEWISIQLESHNDHVLSVDQLILSEENISQIDYRIADERIHFASHRHTNFWNRVKDGFIESTE